MSDHPFTSRSSWIWSAEATHATPAPPDATPSHYQVRLFRRSFEVSDPAQTRLTVHVSGDSRYLFFCNGELIGRGPAKGDINHHFYETHDVTGHLRAGRNVLSALVLDMSRVAHRPAQLGAPCSVMTYTGGFVLDGVLLSDGLATEDLSSDSQWKVAIDRAHRFQNEATTFEGYHGYFEHRVSRLSPVGWTTSGYDDREWPAATVLYKAELLANRRDPTSPYGLLPRMIPALEESAASSRFRDVFLPGGTEAPALWRDLVMKGGAVTVPARTTLEVILDAGELTTAFPTVETLGGAGGTVLLTYAEALRLPWGTPGAKLLGRQQPLANLASHFADESTGWTFDRRGKISGWRDRWEPAALAGGERFEPLHWRTFRYIGISIITGDEPLTVRALSHRFTAYPYQVTAEFACSDANMERIWSVALRTMRLCSHETFEDCPYYEQMQYAGDTMITSKIAMLATGDYRLTKQALHHFDWSRLSEGLTQSRYPSRLVQVIPSWSLHWITTAKDYVQCSGDVGIVHELLPGFRAVLDWFRRHGDADGLPAKLPFWNITDWCPWWPRGVVPGAADGPTCIIVAQYIVALAETATLCELIGRTAEAADLVREADGLRGKLHARFWSEAEGLYFDRPGGPELSQYGNAWAVLCGAAGAREYAIMRRRFPSDERLAPGSFFWWHAGFAALAKGGDYDRMPEFLGPWHESVAAGLDTFVEENSYWRSLCHAWSAHPALEFLTRVLGVTPLAPGFARIQIKPHLCGLHHARGKVCTPRGPVTVLWRRENAAFILEVEAPGDTPVHVLLPDGSEQSFPGGPFRHRLALP
jgi:alpha-L-rhamnosidase